MRPWLILLLAGSAIAQELAPADLALGGMHRGRNTLQDVLSHFGMAPLRHAADVDELCLRVVSYEIRVSRSALTAA